MAQLVVPSVGESIQEVQISNWLKKEGDWVQAGEEVVELETEKATVQGPSPVAGVLTKILKPKEQFATVGEAIAEIDPSAKPASASTPAPATPSAATSSPASKPSAGGHVMPAAQKMMEEKGLRPDQVVGTGPGGRVLKEDVQRTVPPATAASTPTQGTLVAPTSKQTLESPAALPVAASGQRAEEVKPMSMIRRTIAQRLVQAQHQAALLTTFNEVDMQPVMQLRNKYRDAFQEKHGVKLGFMSFFAKAACEALRRFPAVNAEIRGNNIVYRNYADIGIAIGGGKGLVVPVLRNVELMSFAAIERTIGEFAKKAMENRLMPEDLEGGTFTISNGGIYGSLLSTPIVNPPQSAILGLHSIQDRPVAVQGEVVVRPMMYLALTYDHRIIDGREAVTFLRTIKEVIEDPTRLFLEV
jgi:2-oxoglutarate dehydrogenase E2 component (dihydrolipoamide succinyltransferase)